MNEQNIPLQWCQLQFELSPLQSMQLPLYPASTIRGGLGYALKDSPNHEQLYNLLFEEQAGEMMNTYYLAYNRPMVIRTGTNHQRVYKKGDVFSFEMILFGDAIAEYKTIIRAMERFGRQGIGNEKQPFYVKRVISKAPLIATEIYDDGEWVGNPTTLSWESINNLFQTVPKRMKVEFVTPVKLKVDGEYQTTISAPQLIENVTKRVLSLVHFHQRETQVDLALLDAKQVQSELIDTYYEKYAVVSYQRFSTRQQKKIALEGITGTMILQGEGLRSLFPILYIGQFCHVGKQAIFGLGQYELTVYE